MPYIVKEAVNVLTFYCFQGARFVNAHIHQTAQSTAQSPLSLTPPSKAELASLYHVRSVCASQWQTNHLVRYLTTTQAFIHICLQMLGVLNVHKDLDP